MMKRAGENTTLTHLYGLLGLIPGLIGLVFLIKADSSWKDYALFASGWLASVFFAILLVRAFNIARADGETIGRLESQVRQLTEELGRRSTTLDFIAGLHMGTAATPRTAAGSPPPDKE